jgi:hypothetical protein
MDEKQTEEQQETTGSTGTGERRDFEDKLDGLADKFSRTMSDGVKKLEEAFDKGKGNLREDMDSENKRLSGSPRLGVILLGLGLLWLLYALGVLSQPIFPILLIIMGVYFLVRNR